MATENTTVTFGLYTPTQESVRVPVFASDPVSAAQLIEALGDESYTLRRKRMNYGGKRAMVAGATSISEKDNVGGVGLAASKPMSASEIAQRIRDDANVKITPRTPKQPAQRKSKPAPQPAAPANNGTTVQP
jgi:hypothetical protein